MPLSASALLFVAAISMFPAHAQVSDPIFDDDFDGAGPSAAWQSNLDIHNALRAAVTPAAVPALGPMAWSADLAAVAQAYANRCIWSHSGSGLGENLFASSGWVDAESAAATLWAGEASAYTYATNRCASGQPCGHYTQMVWRTSTEVGCGSTRCSTGSPWGAGPWTVVVCNYLLPGNWVGERPY